MRNAFAYIKCTYLCFTAHLYIRTGGYGQWTIVFGVIWNLRGIKRRFNEPSNIAIKWHSAQTAFNKWLYKAGLLTDLHVQLSTNATQPIC